MKSSTLARSVCGLATMTTAAVLVSFGSAHAASNTAPNLPTVIVSDANTDEAIDGGSYSVTMTTGGATTDLGTFQSDSNPDTPGYESAVDVAPTDATDCSTSPTTLTFKQVKAPDSYTPSNGDVTICQTKDGWMLKTLNPGTVGKVTFNGDYSIILEGSAPSGSTTTPTTEPTSPSTSTTPTTEPTTPTTTPTSPSTSTTPTTEPTTPTTEPTSPSTSTTPTTEPTSPSTSTTPTSPSTSTTPTTEPTSPTSSSSSSSSSSSDSTSPSSTSSSSSSSSSDSSSPSSSSSSTSSSSTAAPTSGSSTPTNSGTSGSTGSTGVTTGPTVQTDHTGEQSLSNELLVAIGGIAALGGVGAFKRRLVSQKK